MTRLSRLLIGFSFVWAVRAEGTVAFELVSPTDLTVPQGQANSPEEIFPLQGDTLLVWGHLRNDGNEQVILTGPGNSEGFAPVASIRGETDVIAHLWSEFPRRFWDAEQSPDDPLVTNPHGVSALVLDPGEAIELPIKEVWGVDFPFGDDPLYRAPIGSHRTWSEFSLTFWDGLDRNPNDPFDAPDVFIPLDQSYTVTVVPEPECGTLVFILACTIIARRFSTLSQTLP